MKTLEAPGLDIIESEEQCILILSFLCILITTVLQSSALEYQSTCGVKPITLDTYIAKPNETNQIGFYMQFKLEALLLVKMCTTGLITVSYPVYIPSSPEESPEFLINSL